MKTFTNLIFLTAAAMAAIRSMAAPSTAGAPEAKELKELQFSDSPEFPDSECGTAVEFDLPVRPVEKREVGAPTDQWCCDVNTPPPYMFRGCS